MSEAEPDAGLQSTKPVQSIEGDGERNAKVAPSVPSITDEQWKAMLMVVEHVSNHKIEVKGEEDSYPATLFRRLVNKRQIPEYYEIIKEPVAISTIKAKASKKQYTNFGEFVRDCALIIQNAQMFNRPNSGAVKDALILKSLFESELRILVEGSVITEDMSALPDLGEIPEATPEPDPVSEEEEEDDEDEEDEEADESEDDKKGGKKNRINRTAKNNKRESVSKDDPKADADPRKKRGRPPRVDTPMEARIKAVMKGIRKFKDTKGRLKVRHFEKVPDKATNPGYFMEIKEPIAIDLIKRKSKRKKYQSLEHFMKDVELMFENAKLFNLDESDIYKDAVDLQAEARKLAEQERKKPDADFLMEDGRLPLPEGIEHNGQFWKVGDWVHIQNPNDVTKPIVAQIYRTWQDPEGQKWVNACWYYRPEQTVHQYEKHFYPNEVVKTGQYRDHHIDEVVDRCFVMFFTRYNRGRPRGLEADKEVYVCEARYNEEKHKLNKIKTWASCLPDEVREKDYEMDLFDAPRKIKKIPSPIKDLLKEDAKEDDEVPSPRWGASNAPPIVGAVHKRPREENESPPPEPTPPPPPTPPPAPVRQPSTSVAPRPPTRQSLDGQGDISMTTSTPRPPLPGQSAGGLQHPPPPQPAFHHQHSASPAPPFPRNDSYNSNYGPQTPGHPTFVQPLPPTHPNQYTSRQLNYSAPSHALPAYGPNAQRPQEVFHLPDHANATIPPEIRSQFQQDEQGRVLFFTTPPLDPIAPAKDGQPLQHSARCLVAKAERDKKVAERKRKLAEEAEGKQEAAKRRKVDDEVQLAVRREKLENKVLNAMVTQMNDSMTAEYEQRYGDDGKKYLRADLEHQERQATIEARKAEEQKMILRKLNSDQYISLTGDSVFKDDYDARY